MAQRLELHTLLEGVLGSNNVYFQPPASKQMVYPCIVYNIDDEWAEHANNERYASRWRYQVTVIDRNPDSDIRARVAALPLCAFDRRFAADNLNHDVFNLYF